MLENQMETGETVLGTLELKGRGLLISGNSATVVLTWLISTTSARDVMPNPNACLKAGTDP